MDAMKRLMSLPVTTTIENTWPDLKLVVNRKNTVPLDEVIEIVGDLMRDVAELKSRSLFRDEDLKRFNMGEPIMQEELYYECNHKER